MRQALIDQSMDIPEQPSDSRFGHEPAADFVGYRYELGLRGGFDQSRSRVQSFPLRISGLLIPPEIEQVTQPQSDAVEQYDLGATLADGFGERDGLLNGLPMGRPVLAMAADARVHFSVAFRGCGEIDDCVRGGTQRLCEGAFAAASSTCDER